MQLDHGSACYLVAQGSVAAVRAALGAPHLLPRLQCRTGYVVPLLHVAVHRALNKDQEAGLQVMRILLFETLHHVDILHWQRDECDTWHSQSALQMALAYPMPTDEPVVRLLCKAGAQEPSNGTGRWGARRWRCRSACISLLLMLKHHSLLPRDVRTLLLRTHVWETRYDEEWEAEKWKTGYSDDEDRPPRLVDCEVEAYFD